MFKCDLSRYGFHRYMTYTRMAQLCQQADCILSLVDKAWIATSVSQDNFLTLGYVVALEIKKNEVKN